MTQHPITPPPQLFTEWLSQAMIEHQGKPGTIALVVATRAAQWGADQELEACCDWLVNEGWFKYEHEAVQDLRAARRRPSPQSLKEQALAAAAELEGFKGVDIIRRALESIPDQTSEGDYQNATSTKQTRTSRHAQ